MKIGFDNEKYLKMQSEHIRERIGQFGNKLYLEFGGKLFDDYHASRVLPGFAPDSKLRMLMQLALCAIGAALPCFNLVAVLVPLFTNRITGYTQQGMAEAEAAVRAMHTLSGIEIICVAAGIAVVLMLPRIHHERRNHHATEQ